MVLEIQSVIIKKEIGLNKARKIVEQILKKSNAYMRQKEDTYHFRNLAATKFKPDSYRSKKVNDSVTIVFAEKK